MKRCSTSLVFRKMQIKSTKRHHFTPTRMAKTNKRTKNTWKPQNKAKENKFWSGCGETGTLILCWWRCKMVQILWGKVLTWNYHMAQQSYAEAYTQENWKHVFTQKPCVFIAALFTIAKCPPMEKWINHTWHVHAMEHCVQSRKGM